MTGTFINGGALSGNISINATLTGTLSLGNPTLDSVTVKSTTTEQTITPEAGVDGFSEVTVSALRLRNRVVNPSTSQQVIEPGEGYDGLSRVTVNEVALDPAQTVIPSGEQQVITPAAGTVGLESVTVAAVSLVEKFVDAPGNTDQNVVTPGALITGMSKVTIAALQDKTVTPSASQQVITADSGKYGLRQVTVEAASGGTDVFSEKMYSQTEKTLTVAAGTGSVCYGLYGGLNLVLPAALTSIVNTAFQAFGGLKSVVAPGVVTVGNSAFRDSATLESVVMDAATTIDANAFNMCYALSTVHLAAATSLGTMAFNYCSALKDVFLGANQVCSIGTNVFNHVSKANVHVPAAMLSSYQSDTAWAAAVNANQVVLVGDYA